MHLYSNLVRALWWRNRSCTCYTLIRFIRRIKSDFYEPDLGKAMSNWVEFLRWPENGRHLWTLRISKRNALRSCGAWINGDRNEVSVFWATEFEQRCVHYALLFWIIPGGDVWRQRRWFTRSPPCVSCYLNKKSVRGESVKYAGARVVRSGGVCRFYALCTRININLMRMSYTNSISATFTRFCPQKQKSAGQFTIFIKPTAAISI